MTKFQFAMGRDGDTVYVSLPTVSAVITLIMTLPPHHDQLVCDMLAHVAALVEEEDIVSATEEKPGGPIHMAIEQFRLSHPADGKRFAKRGAYIEMPLSPLEVWAMGESMMAYAGIPQGGPAIDRTVDVWMKGAETLTTAMERLAGASANGRMIQ